MLMHVSGTITATVFLSPDACYIYTNGCMACLPLKFRRLPQAVAVSPQNCNPQSWGCKSDNEEAT